MARSCIPILFCLSVGTGALHAADVDKPVQVDLDDLLKREFVSYRNGLSLEVTHAEIVEAGKKKQIHVHWVLRYSGKRWPLIVLRPSLEDYTYGDTRVGLYARGSDSGKAYCVSFKSAGNPFVRRPDGRKDWFLEIDEKRGKATGVIKINLDAAKKLLPEDYAADFGKDLSPMLYIQLEHLPRDRSGMLELDAWTGELRSKLVKVEGKAW